MTSQEVMSSDDVKRIARGEKVPARFASTITSLTVTLPLPPRELHPNSRRHWRGKLAAKSSIRQHAYHAARHALGNELPPRWKLAEVQTTWYLSRRNDGDNLIGWCKSVFDGIEDAEIVANDSGLIHLPPIQFTGKATNGRREVVLVIARREA